MFAGAAREAVFSNPEVIRRVRADFVPVALKAALVNNPGDDEEGRLYREIGRSRPAPQGICAANSSGKVLAWALMFEDDKGVLAFLDHVQKRYGLYPDAKRPVPAERFMKFPGAKLADVEDSAEATPFPESHGPGKSCPGKPPSPRGTVAARVFGWALGADGKPVADTIRQEHYVEDRFQVTVGMQEALASALADAGTGRARVPDGLARLLASHAYLGHLDVNPVGAPGGKGSLKRCEFWARKVGADEKGPARIRVEGESEAAGASGKGDGSDGRLWRHEVQLAWEGSLEMRESRITRLILVARGSEKLRWGNQRQGLRDEVDVAHLPAGHPIDLACGVRYGIIGEPIPDEEAGPAEAPEPPADLVRRLHAALGPPFFVFLPAVTTSSSGSPGPCSSCLVSPRPSSRRS